MQVVYHLWSALTPDWLRVIADGLPREDPRVPSVTFLWKGAEWARARGLRHVRHHLRGQSRPAAHLHAARLPSFPLRKDFLLPDDSARSPGDGRAPDGADLQPGETRAGRAARVRRASARRHGGRRTGRTPTLGRRAGTRRHDRRPTHPLARRSRHLRRDAGDHLRRRSRRTRRAPSARRSSTTCATARCSSTWARSTRRRTACCASCSRSTASAWWTSIPCSATSTAASRRSARTATGTTRSATATRSSTSPRCSARRCRCSPRRSCSTSRCRAAPSTSACSPGSSTGSPATRLFIGWLALDLGGLTPILWGFIERDEIVEMLAALTGQKLLFNYLRIGGVNGDLNHDFLSRLGDWMSHAGEAASRRDAAPQRERDLRPPHARPGRARPRRPRSGCA